MPAAGGVVRLRGLSKPTRTARYEWGRDMPVYTYTLSDPSFAPPIYFAALFGSTTTIAVMRGCSEQKYW